MSIPSPASAETSVEASTNAPAKEADVLAQYKLAVEMADRVSARRGTANLFYLSIQTTLLTAAGLTYTTTQHAPWYTTITVALTGCSISGAWWRQLQSYKLLNQAKFVVINAMEDQLPVKVFSDEWEILKQQTSSYIELGAIERVVPWLFAVLQILLMVGRLIK
jgi:hypothetical protein